MRSTTNYVINSNIINVCVGAPEEFLTLSPSNINTPFLVPLFLIILLCGGVVCTAPMSPPTTNTYESTQLMMMPSARPEQSSIIDVKPYCDVLRT